MKVVIERHDGTKYTYEDIEQIQNPDKYQTILIKDGQRVAIEQTNDIKSLHTINPD
ncbi:hypothetical protein [Pseudomonas sp. SED1]|uniref:hypothetical protein n=1 Tax=Pseudomonas sp. SED1 TaxID=3056845 RepID=UPI00296F7D22|nr:hypothetical protein [Pseudomonas sp. SED1]MDY0836808.1 hypothetical protein [Pseudomonas sp. SED1]